MSRTTVLSIRLSSIKKRVRLVWTARVPAHTGAEVRRILLEVLQDRLQADLTKMLRGKMRPIR